MGRKPAVPDVEDWSLSERTFAALDGYSSLQIDRDEDMIEELKDRLLLLFKQHYPNEECDLSTVASSLHKSRFPFAACAQIYIAMMKRVKDWRRTQKKKEAKAAEAEKEVKAAKVNL